MKRYGAKDVHLLTLRFDPRSLNIFNTPMVSRECRENTRKQQQLAEKTNVQVHGNRGSVITATRNGFAVT